MTHKLRSSSTVFEDTLYVLHFKNHFMYINYINTMDHGFCCAKCSKVWKGHRDLVRHEKT